MVVVYDTNLVGLGKKAARWEDARSFSDSFGDGALDYGGYLEHG